jgi:hypothetical protein
MLAMVVPPCGAPAIRATIGRDMAADETPG